MQIVGAHIGGTHCSPLLREAGFLVLCTQLTNQEESSEVPLVILDPGLQDLSCVFARRLPSRDSGCVLQAIRSNVLDASRRIVKRNCLDLWMMPKKTRALVEGDGMRQHPPQRRHLH